MFNRRGFSILTIVYIIVGAFVAGANDYFERLGSFQPIISALLAILLWPLVLLGVDLHIGR